MSPHRSFQILLCLATLLGAARLAAQEGNDFAGARVAVLHGSLLASDAGVGRGRPLAVGAVLAGVQVLRTPARGAHAATLELAGGALVTMGPGTTLAAGGDGALHLRFGTLAVATESVPVSVTGPSDFRESVTGGTILSCLGASVQRLTAEPPWLAALGASPTAHARSSLVALVDGKEVPLQLESYAVRAAIRDQVALTTVTSTFRNHTRNRREGTFSFTLPEGAVVTGFAMWIGGERVAGDVVERVRAREIFETIVRTRKDPALLEWQGGNRFTARVFPIEAHSLKRLELTYLQVLPRRGPSRTYRAPLVSELTRAHALRNLSVSIDVASWAALAAVRCPSHSDAEIVTVNDHSATITFETEGVAPERDLELELQLADNAVPNFLADVHAGEGIFLLDLPMALPAAAAAVAHALDLIVVADTSASMTLQRRRAQLEALAALLAQLAPEDHVRLLAFDAEAVWLASESVSPTPEASEQLLAALEARRSLGCSDHALMLGELAPALREGTQVLLLGDGLETKSGEEGADDEGADDEGEGDEGADDEGADDDEWDPLSPVRDLPGAAARGVSFHALVPGEPSDRVLLAELAGLGDAGGSVADLGSDPAGAAARWLATLGAPALADVQIDFSGIEVAALYPDPRPDLRAQESLVVIGRFSATALLAPFGVTVRGTLAGRPHAIEFNIDPTGPGTEHAFLRQLWADQHLRALARLEPTADRRQEMVDLSVRTGVLSPATSLLVLENEWQRQQFAVTRQLRPDSGSRWFRNSGLVAPDATRAAQEDASQWWNLVTVSMRLELDEYGLDVPGLLRFHDGGSFGIMLADDDSPDMDSLLAEMMPVVDSGADSEVTWAAPGAGLPVAPPPPPARDLEWADRSTPHGKLVSLWNPLHGRPGAAGDWNVNTPDRASSLESERADLARPNYFEGSTSQTPLPELPPQYWRDCHQLHEWPPEVTELVARVKRRDRLAGATEPVHLEWFDEVDSDTSDGEAGWIKRADASVGAGGWHLVEFEGDRPVRSEWYMAGIEGGAARRGVTEWDSHLGVEREALSFDHRDMPVALLADSGLEDDPYDLAENWPTLVTGNDGRLILDLDHDQDSPYPRDRLVFESSRDVLLSHERMQASSGDVWDVEVRSDFVQAAGRWWAQTVEHGGGSGKWRRRERVRVTALTPTEHAALLAGVRATAIEPATGVAPLVLPWPRPEVERARHAVRQGRATIADAITLFWSLQQDSAGVVYHGADRPVNREADAAMALARSLVGDHPALRALDAEVESRYRDGDTDRQELAKLRESVTTETSLVQRISLLRQVDVQRKSILQAITILEPPLDLLEHDSRLQWLQAAGDACSRNSQYAQALAYEEQALSVSDDAEQHRRLVHALWRDRQPPESIAERALTAVASHPGWPIAEALSVLEAALYGRTGEYLPILLELDSMGSLRRDVPRAILDLLHQDGRTAEAIATAREWIAAGQNQTGRVPSGPSITEHRLGAALTFLIDRQVEEPRDLAHFEWLLALPALPRSSSWRDTPAAGLAAAWSLRDATADVQRQVAARLLADSASLPGTTLSAAAGALDAVWDSDSTSAAQFAALLAVRLTGETDSWARADLAQALNAVLTRKETHGLRAGQNVALLALLDDSAGDIVARALASPWSESHEQLVWKALADGGRKLTDSWSYLERVLDDWLDWLLALRQAVDCVPRWRADGGPAAGDAGEEARHAALAAAVLTTEMRLESVARELPGLAGRCCQLELLYLRARRGAERADTIAALLGIAGTLELPSALVEELSVRADAEEAARIAALGTWPRERALTTALALGLEGEAGTASLEAFLQQRAVRESATAEPDWRYHLVRLLVLSGRRAELPQLLAGWDAAAGHDPTWRENRWRVALGWLAALDGDLDTAARWMAAAREHGFLAIDCAMALARWQEALGRSADARATRAGLLEGLDRSRISNRIHERTERLEAVLYPLLYEEDESVERRLPDDFASDLQLIALLDSAQQALGLLWAAAEAMRDPGLLALVPEILPAADPAELPDLVLEVAQFIAGNFEEEHLTVLTAAAEAAAARAVADSAAQLTMQLVSYTARAAATRSSTDSEAQAAAAAALLARVRDPARDTLGRVGFARVLAELAQTSSMETAQTQLDLLAELEAGGTPDEAFEIRLLRMEALVSRKDPQLSEASVRLLDELARSTTVPFSDKQLTALLARADGQLRAPGFAGIAFVEAQLASTRDQDLSALLRDLLLDLQSRDLEGRRWQPEWTVAERYADLADRSWQELLTAAPTRRNALALTLTFAAVEAVRLGVQGVVADFSARWRACQPGLCGAPDTGDAAAQEVLASYLRKTDPAVAAELLLDWHRGLLAGPQAPSSQRREELLILNQLQVLIVDARALEARFLAQVRESLRQSLAGGDAPMWRGLLPTYSTHFWVGQRAAFVETALQVASDATVDSDAVLAACRYLAGDLGEASLAIDTLLEQDRSRALDSTQRLWLADLQIASQREGEAAMQLRRLDGTLTAADPLRSRVIAGQCRLAAHAGDREAVQAAFARARAFALRPGDLPRAVFAREDADIQRDRRRELAQLARECALLDEATEILRDLVADERAAAAQSGEHYEWLDIGNDTLLLAEVELERGRFDAALATAAEAVASNRKSRSGDSEWLVQEFSESLAKAAGLEAFATELDEDARQTGHEQPEVRLQLARALAARKRPDLALVQLGALLASSASAAATPDLQIQRLELLAATGAEAPARIDALLDALEHTGFHPRLRNYMAEHFRLFDLEDPDSHRRLQTTLQEFEFRTR